MQGRIQPLIFFNQHPIEADIFFNTRFLTEIVEIADIISKIPIQNQTNFTHATGRYLLYSAEN